MKDNESIKEHVFRLWSEENMTYETIASLYLPSFLSLSRIRSIIYGRSRSTIHQRQILRLFHIEFQKTNNIDQSIKFVFENQPDLKYSVRTIRRYINYTLKNKKSQSYV